MDYRYYEEDKSLNEYIERVKFFQENCPHIDKNNNSTFEYKGHNHNDDVYKCTLCGKLEYR